MCVIRLVSPTFLTVSSRIKFIRPKHYIINKERKKALSNTFITSQRFHPKPSHETKTFYSKGYKCTNWGIFHCFARVRYVRYRHSLSNGFRATSELVPCQKMLLKVLAFVPESIHYYLAYDI